MRFRVAGCRENGDREAGELQPGSVTHLRRPHHAAARGGENRGIPLRHPHVLQPSHMLRLGMRDEHGLDVPEARGPYPPQRDPTGAGVKE
jgi:hypothetical protein